MSGEEYPDWEDDESNDVMVANTNQHIVFINIRAAIRDAWLAYETREMTMHDLLDEWYRFRWQRDELLAACERMIAAFRRGRYAKMDDEYEAFQACGDAAVRARGSWDAVNVAIAKGEDSP